MSSEEKVDDYSTYKRRDGSVCEAAETAVLVVRPGCTYGKTPAGGRVRVATSDLDAGTLRVLMSLKEYSEVEAARERKRLAKQKPKVGKLKAMVDAAIGSIPPRAEKK